VPVNLLMKKFKMPTLAYHGTNKRLTKLVDGHKLPSSNADLLFGNGVYMTTKRSAELYALKRSIGSGHPMINTVDLHNKKLFDLRRLVAAFKNKKIMLSQTDGYIGEIKGELIEILEEFILFLQLNIDKTKSSCTVMTQPIWIKKIQFLARSRNLLTQLKANQVSSTSIHEWYMPVESHNDVRQTFAEFLQTKGYKGLIALEKADHKTEMVGNGDLAIVLFEKNGILSKAHSVNMLRSGQVS
jgi:hypothetical protein